MTVKKYIGFTTPYCHACKPIKEFMKGMPVTGEFMDASQGEGSDKAVSFNITNVPTIIFFDENNQEVGRAQDVMTIRSMLED